VLTYQAQAHSIAMTYRPLLHLNYQRRT